MKIRLSTGYRLLGDCKAHGQTYGCSWWIVNRPTDLYSGMSTIILPDAGFWDRERRHTEFGFRYPHSKADSQFSAMISLSSMPIAVHVYPPALSGAFCLTFHCGPDFRNGYGNVFKRYTVNTLWVAPADTGTGVFHVPENLIVPFCVRATWHLCGQFFRRKLYREGLDYEIAFGERLPDL